MPKIDLLRRYLEVILLRYLEVTRPYLPRLPPTFFLESPLFSGSSVKGL